jgi:hypothetical protein
VAEWSSYALSDFILFAPQTYARLIAQFNGEMWPWQILAVLACLFLTLAVARPAPVRLRATFALLGIAWATTAYLFVWQQYAVINWPLLYIAPLLGLQALGLLVAAVWPRPGSSRHAQPSRMSVTLIAAVVAGYPVASAWIAGTFERAELIGLFPDPTVAATLAILAARPGWWAVAGLIIPALWLVLSALTLSTLGSPAYVLPVIALALAGLVRFQTARENAR